jgi:hypothetical protein
LQDPTPTLARGGFLQLLVFSQRREIEDKDEVEAPLKEDLESHPNQPNQELVFDFLVRLFLQLESSARREPI